MPKMILNAYLFLILLRVHRAARARRSMEIYFFINSSRESCDDDGKMQEYVRNPRKTCGYAVKNFFINVFCISINGYIMIMMSISSITPIIRRYVCVHNLKKLVNETLEFLYFFLACLFKLVESQPG